ncbi:hypothetical protein CRM22_000241 [Opisthorchis felineus]|uniref:Methylmalonic aciduria and homocystinuria type D protein, mitochondrial n=1 Tax=Opisthorchis felineus TaxID=147828 RepID=A0A4S2MMW6_OPIFE|nr:hypothetical protein CRM22_000241 [Opisthorchis felineus]
MRSLSANRVIFKNFERLVSQFRLSVSAYSAFQRTKPIGFVIVGTRSSKLQWPDPTLGPIDCVNPNYPLPGGIGLQGHKNDVKQQPKPFIPATLTLPPAREENYASALIETYNSTELNDGHVSLIPQKSENLECTIHTCPTLIKQDLAAIFPSRRFETSQLTAIVLSHRTTEGLSEWSELAANEREAIAETFTRSAIDICASLKELGYWADFINPYTGTPYLGAHGEAVLSETDEKMKHFGFEIDDVRCCKVLRHPRWKHNVFAGLIFTDAPKDHPVLAHF